MAEGDQKEERHEGVLNIPHEEHDQQPASGESPDQPAPAAEIPAAEPQAQSEPHFYNAGTAEGQPAPASGTPDSINWTASEFVAHDKSASWYLGLAVSAAILAFFVYVISRDFISVIVVIAAAVIFGIYASHRPRQLEYILDPRGLTVGGKRYGFDLFRSYSVVPEGGVSSIVFMPLKRFGAPLTIYYAPADEKQILAILGNSLPYENPRRDTVDAFMKKIRF